MTVGILVISTNEGELLRHALAPALEQEDVDVMVLDNSSTDSTAAVAAELGVRCVRLEQRRPWPAAMNVALREVTGDAVLFLQPDCYLTSGFVERVLARLDDPEVGSVAPKLVRTLGPLPEQRLDAIDTAGMTVDRLRKNRLVGHGRPALAFDRPAEAFGADGALALYRRAALDDLALDGQVIDEDLVAWGSDADLAWRARVLGWRCVYEPGAVAYHVRTYSPSTRALMPDWDRAVQFRNRYMMTAKNDPLPTLLRDLPRILFYELLVFGFALVRERALLRGYWEALLLLPRMIGKRRLIQRKRRERGVAPPAYGLEPPA